MHKGRWVSAAVLLLGGTAAQAGGALQGLVSRDLATTSGRIAGAPAMRSALAAPALSSLSGPAGAALMGVTASRALPGLEVSSNSSSRSEDENHDEGGDGNGNGRGDGHENGHGNGNGRGDGHENGHGNGNGRGNGHENGHGNGNGNGRGHQHGNGNGSGNGNGNGNEAWLDYNLQLWPGQVTAWGESAIATSLAETNAVAVSLAGGDLSGAGNRAAGLLGKVGPAPAPQLPYGVPGVFDTLWLDYNLRRWQGDMLTWTSASLQTIVTETSEIILAAGAGGDLTGAANRAAGLLGKVGPAPAPQLPGGTTPASAPN